jgi:hypothetical protein
MLWAIFVHHGDAWTRVDECLHGDDLPNDQDRERVEVDLVEVANLNR